MGALKLLNKETIFTLFKWIPLIIVALGGCIAVIKNLLGDEILKRIPKRIRYYYVVLFIISVLIVLIPKEKIESLRNNLHFSTSIFLIVILIGLFLIVTFYEPTQIYFYERRLFKKMIRNKQKIK